RHTVRDVVVSGLALLPAVGLGAHAVRARDQVQVEAVALGRHGPGELGGKDGSGAGHDWRMAKRRPPVNAGVAKARPLAAFHPRPYDGRCLRPRGAAWLRSWRV